MRHDRIHVYFIRGISDSLPKKRFRDRFFDLPSFAHLDIENSTFQDESISLIFSSVVLRSIVKKFRFDEQR